MGTRNLTKINKKLNSCYETMEELLDALSKMFEKKCDEFDDAQIAFDDLNDDIGDNILSNNFCYCLSDGGEWSIDCNELTSEMIISLNKANINVKDKEEFESYLERKVCKCESNVGCDARTALALELEDLPSGFDWENIVFLSIPEGNPIIEYLG